MVRACGVLWKEVWKLNFGQYGQMETHHSQKEAQTWRRSEMKKVRREKMQVREKIAKSPNAVFFPMSCGPGGSTSRLAKAAGAEPAGQMKDEKLHAIVARSTFASQNVQNTSASERF